MQYWIQNQALVNLISVSFVYKICHTLFKPDSNARTCINLETIDLVENSRAIVIFRGPDHYISPSWYEPSDNNVPTWNYTAVHLECLIEVVEGKAREVARMMKETRDQ